MYAFSEAVKDTNLLLWRAEDMGIPVTWPANIQEDNKATISFQQTTTPTSKLRGIYNLRWGWVLQMRNLNRFKAIKVATEDNVADMMTKCYRGHEINKMLKKMSIYTNF